MVGCRMETDGLRSVLIKRKACNVPTLFVILNVYRFCMCWVNGLLISHFSDVCVPAMTPVSGLGHRIAHPWEVLKITSQFKAIKMWYRFLYVQIGKKNVKTILCVLVTCWSTTSHPNSFNVSWQIFSKFPKAEFRDEQHSSTGYFLKLWLVDSGGQPWFSMCEC